MAFLVMPKSIRFRFGLFALLLAAAVSFEAAAYLAQAGAGLLRQVEERFGGGGRQRLERWQREETMIGSRHGTEPGGLLVAVNALANRVPAANDTEHWGQVEYWATPAEFVSSNGGDCEDYAIAKYAALRAAGVPSGELRLAYVKALTGGRIENHMVLAWYRKQDADPLILDNLDRRVLPASARPDLVPVFSFNDEDAGRDGIPMVRRWRDLQQRIAAERAL
jgi:predicted transglutaminase-like cysteine proteinase